MCTSRDPDDVDRTERERRERDHDYGQVERKMAYHAFDLTSTTLAGLGSLVRRFPPLRSSGLDGLAQLDEHYNSEPLEPGHRVDDTFICDSNQ